MEGTGGGSGAGAHPDRQQHQQQDQPEQQQQQPAHTSWRAAGARGARAAGGGRPSSLGSRAPAGPAQDPVPRVAEQRPSMMSRTINKRATPPPPAPPAPSAPRRAPGASDDDPTAAALAAAASALALEASKPAAGKAGDGDAPKGSRPLARTPLSQTPTPPPVPELDGAAAADAADEELQEVAAGELDMTALADVSVPALPVQGKDQPPPRSQQQEEDDHEQEQGQEATEEAKPVSGALERIDHSTQSHNPAEPTRTNRSNHFSTPQHKGRRFWAALRKTPIDPVSNRQICFGFNRGACVLTAHRSPIPLRSTPQPPRPTHSTHTTQTHHAHQASWRTRRGMAACAGRSARSRTSLSRRYPAPSGPWRSWSPRCVYVQLGVHPDEMDPGVVGWLER